MRTGVSIRFPPWNVARMDSDVGFSPGGGGLLWLIFGGYVPLASQNPLPHYTPFCGQL